jgi:hypothetical protein
LPDQTQPVPNASRGFVLGDASRLLDVDTQVHDLLDFTQARFLAGGVALGQRIHPDDQNVAATLFSPKSEARHGMLNLRVPAGRAMP